MEVGEQKQHEDLNNELLGIKNRQISRLSQWKYVDAGQS